MKIRMAMRLVLMLACLATVPVGCGGDDDPAGFGDFTGNVSLAGNWTLYYRWAYNPQSVSVPFVNLQGDTGGTFTVEGYSGTWSLNGSTFTMVYAGGDPVYTGELEASGNSIFGTMTSSEFGSGTFEMHR